MPIPPRKRPCRMMPLAAAAAVAILAGPAPPAEAPPPAAGSGQSAEEINARLVGQLVDFLTAEYSKQLLRPGWMTRASADVGFSRLPTEEATKCLLDHLRKEKHPVAQLVAWQALLGRASILSAEDFRAWHDVTQKMITAGQFQGDLRIGLLEMLSSVPMTQTSRTHFTRLFATTNSLDSRDIPALVAMGHAARAWADAGLVETLLDHLRAPATAYRAELVLRAAGAGGRWARDVGPEAAQAQYRDWWKEARAAFTAAPPPADGWRSLKPQYLPAPTPLGEFDRFAEKWRKELELGDLGLALMGISINIDCSRSMHMELERLKRDVSVMMAALAMVAKEPRIAITLFTTGGVTDTLPLTTNLDALVAHIGKARSAGVGTEEEWAGGLLEALTRSAWGPIEPWNRRVIVLISDEPMLNWQFDLALPVVKKAAASQFRVYCVPLHNGPVIDDPLSVPLDRTGSRVSPPASRGGGGGGGAGKAGKAGGKADRSWDHYTTIANESGGAVIEVRVPNSQLGLGRLVAPARGSELAPLYEGGGPVDRILTRVLTDAINPKYADRIEPLMKILVAYCQGAARSLPEDRATVHPPMKPEQVNPAGKGAKNPPAKVDKGAK